MNVYAGYFMVLGMYAGTMLGCFFLLKYLYQTQKEIHLLKKDIKLIEFVIECKKQNMSPEDIIRLWDCFEEQLGRKK